MDTTGNIVMCDVIVEDFINIYENALKAIKETGLTPVAYKEHKFTPHGKTMVWILSESHFIIHTYPEHNYLSIDCYTCGGVDPIKTVMVFLDHYKLKKVDISYKKRGEFT